MIQVREDAGLDPGVAVEVVGKILIFGRFMVTSYGLVRLEVGERGEDSDAGGSQMILFQAPVLSPASGSLGP